MALDTRTFKTRTLSAIVFAIVMLIGLLWNKVAFILLFTIILAGAYFEFIKLMKKIYPSGYGLKILWGVPYLLLPILLLLWMRTQPFEGSNDTVLKVLPCGIIFSIWINDTMAYITGSFIGKTPLSKISPKKTWEGTLGGIILCVITITLLGKITGYFKWNDWLFISLICAIAGTLGDLLESKLKRMAGVKDSGSIMPGHGGFLDRFDSLLIAVPFVFLYYIFNII